jgi:hypothetical protein
MDEVDGMSGGDRGGSAELARLIRNTKVKKIILLWSMCVSWASYWLCAFDSVDSHYLYLQWLAIWQGEAASQGVLWSQVYSVKRKQRGWDRWVAGIIMPNIKCIVHQPGACAPCWWRLLKSKLSGYVGLFWTQAPTFFLGSISRSNRTHWMNWSALQETTFDRSSTFYQHTDYLTTTWNTATQKSCNANRPLERVEGLMNSFFFM